jgi:cyclopropane-fatty-acyl-phospholipid synthase
MKNYDLIWLALENADCGSIKIILPDGLEKNFKGKNLGPEASIIIKNYQLIDAIISGGDVAFGEAYIKGMWDSSDLSELLTFLTANSCALENFFHARKFKSFVLFLRSFFTKNTKRGSKKNIQAHYDLGNDFYELWLDKTMTYSSAIFNNEALPLEDAQRAKYQNILSKLRSETILEIGCGWGGFAEAAAKVNKKITCLTISERQQEYAARRIAKQNLDQLAKIKLQDYREEKGVYDNVVSIEMFEAVGQEYWNKFFQVVKNSLKPSGKAVLQIITIDEQVFKDYKNRVDFIQKHIFPGGVLPSKTKIRELAKNHGFKINDEFCFGQDYSKTLAIWLKNFDAKYEQIKSLGFNDEFIRKWRFYLCYCIAGFNSKRTDVVQFELEKNL